MGAKPAKAWSPCSGLLTWIKTARGRRRILLTEMLIKPLPVMYACAGCAQFGYAAPRVASALDRRGIIQAIGLDGAPARVTGRYPIYSLDACERGCALQWVRAHGAIVDRAFVLEPQERDDLPAALERIAASL